MKNIFVIVLLFISVNAFSQTDTTSPYLKSKIIPNFKLLSLDSTIFTQTILSEKAGFGKNTIIMLFNPGCGHCKEQLELLLKIPEFTKSTNLILTSSEPIYKLQEFYNKYQLNQYPLVHIGKDYSYFFGGFYQPKTIPVLAFYNKQKKLTYFNQGNVSKRQIIQALK